MKNLSVFKISLLISILYCLIGNFIGILNYNRILNDENFLVLLFLPYTLIWGLGSLVGLDIFALIIELLFIYILAWVFLPFGIIISKRK